MKHVILFSLSICFAILSYSQNGTLRGSVYDEANGEPLIGVSVVIDGKVWGSSTDLDGKFSLSLEPGTYNVIISYISYETLTLENVNIVANEVTLLNEVVMKESSMEIDEVVITAKANTATINAVMIRKKNAVEMLDGISSDQIKLAGDGTAVEAAKRVTGVSIEGGKYVYIRGLGDRYSKTTFNDMEIPGLDPDRNTLQLDIFPTNLIGNIMVSKNFTADKSADFTGGLMNIETKDFPEEKIFSVSFSTSYNPKMHFNDDYLTYEGGSTDFLAMDDGTRALPSAAVGLSPGQVPTPGVASESEVSSFVRSFNDDLGVDNKKSFVDLSASITAGNQFDLKDQNKKLGYVFSLSYKSDYKYYDDAVFGEYQRDISSNQIFELLPANVQTGSYGERNFLLGGLAGLAYKNKTAKHKISFMRIQSASSRAGQFTKVNNSDAVGQSGYKGISDNLEYNQRSISNLLLSGEYILKDAKWRLNWKVSPTLSKSEDPDIRSTAFTYLNDTVFSAGDAGLPNRIWRSLEEVNLPTRVDLSRDIQLFSRDARVKFGFSHVYKQRDYEIVSYQLRLLNTVDQQWSTTDPDLVLTEENIYPSGNGVYYISGNNIPNPNQYNSNLHNTGLYVSGEFSPFNNLKAIVGLRTEYFVQRHTGRDASLNNRLDNNKVLESIDFFPSVNMIYALSENQKIRTSYSRTIARPSFKEMSFASIVDPFTNRTFNGGLFPIDDWDGDLHETFIHNFDLRWEYYMGRGESISFSGFFKQFNDPIELVRISSAQTTVNYQPRNVGDAIVLGGEAEVRKSLGFIHQSLNNFYLSGNFTITHSEVEMTEDEFLARNSAERQEGETDRKREMAGQAPYVVNAGLTYSKKEIGVESGLFYNMKGKTLFIVGNGLNPDVYDVPFHSLNFSFVKKFGEEQNAALDFKVSNILNSKRERVFESFKASDQIYSFLDPGITFSLGASFKF